MCTINDNHMMYGSWVMKCNKQNFLLIWTIFCLLPPKNLKNKNFEKMKISFYIGVPKIMIICYTVPEIWQVMDVIVIFHFGLYFALLPPSAQKIKISKKWKNNWRYHHFRHVYQKLWLDDVRFLRYSARWTDRQTDGRTDRQTEKVTYTMYTKIIVSSKNMSCRTANFQISLLIERNCSFE